MKMKSVVRILKAVGSIAAVLCVVAGCSLFGPNASGPSTFDQKLFDITTNMVSRVVTNTVTITNSIIVPITQTNVVVQTVNVTNTTGVVIPQTNTTFEYKTVLQTNTVLTTNSVTQTNIVPVYTYVPNSAATNVSSIAGTLSNIGLPGIGSLVSMGVIGALGIYGKLRGNKVAGALAQGIETARAVIQTTPQGQQLDANFKAWLVAHQSAAGVINTVSSIVNNAVNTPTGEAIADAGAKTVTSGVPTITAITTAPAPNAGPVVTTTVAAPKV